MDEYTDAWFIGFDPNITIGVWVGYDEKKPLGNGETGAKAALPIWMDIMKAYIASARPGEAAEFEAPGNIVFVSVDKTTGAPSNGDEAITEAFIAGTQPEGAAARPAQPGLAKESRKSRPQIPSGIKTSRRNLRAGAVLQPRFAYRLLAVTESQAFRCARGAR